jgi:hypothetical protein
VTLSVTRIFRLRLEPGLVLSTVGPNQSPIGDPSHCLRYLAFEPIDDLISTVLGWVPLKAGGRASQNMTEKRMVRSSHCQPKWLEHLSVAVSKDHKIDP